MDPWNVFWFSVGVFTIWYVFFDGDSFIRTWYRRLKRRILGGI